MKRPEAAMLLALTALLGLVSQAPASPSTAAAAGRVLDESTRAPLVNAKVTLLPSAEERRASPYVRPMQVLTDAGGRFVLTGVAPGRHTVQVAAPGYRGRNASVTARDPATGASANEPDVLLSRGGVVYGRVLDAGGAPVEGAHVLAQRKVDRGRVGTPVGGALAPGIPGPRLVSISVPAQTNARGEFTIDAIEAGPYYIRASAPSMRSREVSPGSGRTTKAIPTYYPGTSEPDSALPIVAPAGQPIDVGDIRLQFAAAFSVSGAVVDETGQPVEHARVRLVPADASNGGLPMTGAMGHSDANGVFVLSGVQSGHYVLVAVPPIVVMHGTTRQFRDELGTTVPVDVSDGSLFEVRVIVKRP